MDKKSKIIMITLSIVICCVGVLIFFKSQILKDDLKANQQNAIGETDITKKAYGYPLITVVLYDGNINIEAGIYRFGDINQDGEVGLSDYEALKIMVDTDKIGFTEEQIKIADVNEDTKIDDNDLKTFDKYLKKNGNVKYNVRKDLLEYCVVDSNDVNKCNWKKDSVFKVDEIKDYYVFIKQTDNNRVSESLYFEKALMIPGEE